MSYKNSFHSLFLILVIISNLNFAQQKASILDTSSIKYLEHSIELDIKEAISISYRNYFSSTWDFALNISYEGKYKNEKGDAISSPLNERSDSELTIYINPKINYRLVEGSILKLFLGCGVFFSYSNYYYEGFYNERESHDYHTFQNREFGATISVQMDVDVIKNIKLLGKYDIFAGWGNESTNTIRIDEKNNKKFIELDNLTIGVGISF